MKAPRFRVQFWRRLRCVWAIPERLCHTLPVTLCQSHSVSHTLSVILSDWRVASKLTFYLPRLILSCNIVLQIGPFGLKEFCELSLEVIGWDLATSRHDMVDH